MMTEMDSFQRALNRVGAPVLVAFYSKLLAMKLHLKKDNWLIRVGDLHVVMAMLRCIGVRIDRSGLPAGLTA